MAKTQIFTEKLMRDPNAADQLRIADNYIRQLHQLGRHFALPKEYAHLKPLIDAYSDDQDQFVQLVKHIRDTVPPKQEGYVALHELYRTLLVRQVQHARRVRAGRALDWLKSHHPLLTAKQRLAWVHKLEQQWGRRRMKMMEEARKTSYSERLNTTEREQLLEAFWRAIDAEIDKGQLPHP
jgi:hypothetical protein